MAVKSTKTKSKTRAKNKSVAKKSITKRRTAKKQKKSNLKKNIFVILGVLITISLVAFGYFLGNNNPSEKSTTLHSKISEEDRYHNQKPKVIKKEKTPLKSQTIQTKKVEKKVLKVKLQKKQVVLTFAKGKPRLAIIIDDVSTATQMKRIQATGVKLTPSIFPPSELSMRSHKLAIPLEHYMIHLPMESGNKQFNTHHKTLMVNSSIHMIEQRVKEIRRLFPKAKYINNHTGSVFTANYSAMYKLYRALNKQGFVFIDSRTIGSSKVKKVAGEFGNAYISRDIFIDNEHNIPYIHKQLKEAVAIAKRRGYAIAIGHPHKITMQALQQAKMILSDVEIVYIDDMFK